MAQLLPRLHAKAFTGGVIVMMFIAVGIFGPKIAPQDPNKQELTALTQPPQGLGSAHVLGTDNLGRDIFSRIIHGARVSLLVAFAVVFISGIIGVSLGAISGYFGGKTDFLIQKLVEVVWAFPPLLLGITIMAFLGQGLFNLILALVIQRWIPYCRVVRGQALSLRSREFVVAAQCLGAGKAQIIVRHIIPNVIQTSLVIGTFAMASAIIAEASLSFLGVGVPPEIPTWGTMLADARIYISTAWWLPLFPGLCIFITVLGINLLGDALRDVLDPRLKRTGAGL
jgi:peptide/nickel transport system permease protein